jgi:exonuclease SbcC
MRLLRIEATNFLSYEDLDLDLAGADEFALIGPVGAGKSSLQNAMLFSVYGEARGSTRADKLMREGATAMLIRTTWKVGEQEVVITRERETGGRDGKSSLTFVVDDANLTRHTIAETQAAIEAFVGMPLAAVTAGPVMAQGDSDALMGLDPAPRKELLFRMLGLDRFEDYASRFRSALTSTDVAIAVATRTVDDLAPLVARAEEVEQEYQSALDDRRTAGERLRVAEGDYNALSVEAAVLAERSERLQELRERMAEAVVTGDRASVALSTLDIEKAQHEAVVARTMPTVDSAPLDALDVEVRQVAEWWGEWKTDMNAVGTLTATVEATRRRIAMAPTVPCGGTGKYAACAFLANVQQDVLDLAAQEHRLADLTVKASSFAEVDEKYERLRKERDLARQALDAARREHGEWSASRQWLDTYDTMAQGYASAVAEAARVQKESLPKVRELEKDESRAAIVAELLILYTDTVAQARLAVSTTQERAAKLAALRESIDDARVRMDDQTKELTRLADRRQHLDVLCRAFGRDGIPTLVLENSIPAIEDHANDALDRMPGGFKVSLITQQETKSGTVRDTLDVVVLVGAQQRPYQMLSGGERLRVDVALRVAVSAIAGGRWGTFFMDEPVGGQDRDGREGVLQVMGMLGESFPLVIVATHDEDFADRFPVRLRVSKNEDGASVVEAITG